MLNKAILMGRLTADPELRHTTSNISVTTFSLAVDRRYTKPGEEKVTDFIDVVCWRSTAEFASRYFKKGMQIVVCGSIQTRNWEDKQGQKRKSTEVVADEVFFADSKRADGGASGMNMPPQGGNFDLPASDFSPISGDDELPF